MKVYNVFVAISVCVPLIACVGSGLEAEKQQTVGVSMIEPNLEDASPDGVTIRYIEAFTFGGAAAPESVINAAIKHCAQYGKQAFHQGTGRGMVYGYTTKAFYKCS